MARDHSLRSGGDTQAACSSKRTATLRVFGSPDLMQTLHPAGGVHLLRYFEQLRFGRRPYRLTSGEKCGVRDVQVVQGPAIGTPGVHGREDASESDTASLT